MIDHLRRRLAVARAGPGDGRTLAPMRWWQLPGRALFHLETEDSGLPVRYTVDVRHWGNQSAGTVRAQLFADGRQVAVSRLPAAFPVPGGVIEVAMSAMGMKRCHHVPDGGTARQLRPDPRTAEGRRAGFEDRHPVASRRIGVVSVLSLLLGIGVLVLQLVEPLSTIPPVREHLGHLRAPFILPLWLNTAVAVLTAAAGTERASRLRHRWWLDALGS